MTKDQILKCNDGQKLADAVAVEVMGWHKIESQKPPYEVFQTSQAKWVKDWQPHLPTEKGKAQAIGLAEKYKLAVHFDSEYVASNRFNSAPRYLIRFKEAGTWQIAVLKAVLLSQLGEE